MEYLGLGVRLDMDDNLTNRVDPIVRDIERLERSARSATSTIDAFGNKMGYVTDRHLRAQKFHDISAAIRGTDQALLSISRSLVNATASANSFANATNQMQSLGSFNRLNNDIMRVQSSLAYMGFGMSEMQKQLMDNRAFQAFHYQAKELEDRINLTKKALVEMQNSPDSSKFVEEMTVARRSLSLLEGQLKSVNAQQKIANDMGMQSASFMGREHLFRLPDSTRDQFRNQMLGLSLLDVAAASGVAYNSIDKTAKMMAGAGLTAIEARQRITQLSTALTTLGMVMTTTVTLGAGIATAAMGVFASKFEEAQNQFQARTLVMDVSMNTPNGYDDSIADIWVNKGGEYKVIGQEMAQISNAMGTMPVDRLRMLTSAGVDFSKAWGTDAGDTILKSMGYADRYGLSAAQSFDIMGLALKESNGDLAAAGNYIENNIGSLRRLTAEGQNGAKAFENMSSALGAGGIAPLMEGLRGGADIFRMLWEDGLQGFVANFGNGLQILTGGIREFLTLHTGVSKVTGLLVAGAVGFLGLVGPIALITGGLIRFKSLIDGVTASVFGLSQGGLAVLSPQALMAKQRTDALVTSIARFPQTMLSTIPLFYSMIRLIPGFLYQIARTNPVMTAATLGFLAYQQNFMGFGDFIKGNIDKVKTAWSEADAMMMTGRVPEKMSTLTETFAKMQGVGKVAGAIFRDWGNDTVTFTDSEVNLMKNLGIEGIATKMIEASAQVESFFDGFISGAGNALDIGKRFITEVWDAMSDRLQSLGQGAIDVFNTINRAFGGEGNATLDTVMEKFTGATNSAESLGRVLGTAVVAFAGLKGAGMIISAIVSPFAKLGDAIGKSITNLRTLKGLMTFGGMVLPNSGGNKGGTVPTYGGNVTGTGGTVGGTGGHTTPVPTTAGGRPALVPTVPLGTPNRTQYMAPPSQLPQAGTAHSMSGGVMIPQGASSPLIRDNNGNVVTPKTPTPVTGAGVPYGPAFPPMLAAPLSAGERVQRRDAQTRERAASRYRNMGTPIGNAEADRLRNSGRTIAQNRENQSRVTSGGRLAQGNRQIYQRRQGVMSRALFGQAYDSYDNNGRRQTVNRQGGLLRSSRADGRVGANASLGRRASVTARRTSRNAQNVVGRALSPVTSRVDRGVSRAAGAMRSATMMPRIGASMAASKAMKPITVPVKYVSGRLNTAGVTGQARAAGTRAGGLFSRAFSTVTGRSRVNMNGATRSAGTAGTRAGGQFGRNMSRSAQRSGRMERIFSSVERSAGRVGGRTGRTLGRGITNSARAGIRAGSMFRSVTRGAANAGRSGGRMMGRGVTTGLRGVARGIPKLFMLGFRAIPILGWALLAWDVISAVFRNWDAIVSGAKKAWNWIKTDGKQMAVDIMSSIKEKLGEAWNWMKTEGVTKMGEFVSEAGTRLMDLAGKALEAGMQIGKNIYDAAMGWVGDLVSAAGEKIAGIGKSIGGAVSGFVGNLVGGGKKEYAEGGFISTPHLGLVGEAGPEVIIPLSTNRRSRALHLFEKTKSLLGIGENKTAKPMGNFLGKIHAYANGGVVGSPKAPTSGGATGSGGSSAHSLKLNIGADLTAQGEKAGEKFSKAVGSSLLANKVPTDTWSKENIDSPMGAVVKRSVTYGAGIVKEFSKGQNGQKTGTGSYLNTQVERPMNSVVSKSPTWGSGMMNNFISGMRSKSSAVAEAGKYLAKQVENAFKEGLDIHSPSRVMKQLGMFASIGIVEGLDSVDIKKFTDKQVEKMMASFGGANFSGGGAQMASRAISTALRMLGKSQAFLPGLMKVAQHESGFNPNAINNWDINAKRGDPSVGLFQIINSTFQAHKYPGANNRRNPLHSALAAIRYLDSRYGGIQNHPGLKSLSRGGGYKPYANGGFINSPHMGLVGEDGEEAIIPLTKPNRAMQLMKMVGSRLGMNVVPRTSAASQNLSAQKSSGGSTAKAVSVDNSVTIQKLEVNFSKEASKFGEVAARKQALLVMKEFQKLYKEAKLRKGEKDLSLDEMILDL